MSRRPSRRSAPEAEPRRTGRRDGELTVDELAAETGMTVRNVRAYSSRGLLPPPRLEGRTGYYGPDHVARLTLVREMLDQGYTLTAAEKLISAAPGSGSQALGLYHAIMSPWEGIEPEVVEPLSLAREAGIAYDRKLVETLIALELAVETEDARLEIGNPTLVRAGLQVIATGVPADRVLGIVPALREHADAVSQLFVGLFFDSVWKEFSDAGMPARQWPRIQQAIEEIIPLAGQALLAAFQASLGDAVTAAMRVGLEGVEGLDPAEDDEPAAVSPVPAIAAAAGPELAAAVVGPDQPAAPATVALPQDTQAAAGGAHDDGSPVAVATSTGGAPSDAPRGDDDGPTGRDGQGQQDGDEVTDPESRRSGRGRRDERTRTEGRAPRSGRGRGRGKGADDHPPAEGTTPGEDADDTDPAAPDPGSVTDQPEAGQDEHRDEEHRRLSRLRVTRRRS